MISNTPSLNSLRGVSWGVWHGTQRMIEISAPPREGPLSILSHYTEGLLVGDRLTLLVGLSGGHLKVPREEILFQLKSRFRSRLWEKYPTPLQQVSTCLNWLEQEQNSGILEHCLINLVLIVNISETRLWIWRVGGNGVLAGKPDALRFLSTDQRQAAFRRQGFIPPLKPRFPQSELLDDLLAVFELTTPDGYESFFVDLDENPLVVVLNKSTLPFGPWPSSPLDISRVWSLDAGWKHGMAGHGVIIGKIGIDRVGWPHDYRLIKIVMDIKPAWVAREEFHLRAYLRVLIIKNVEDDELIKSYSLAKPDENIRRELAARVRAAMASPKETGAYQGAVEEGGCSEEIALQAVELCGLISLVFLGEKEAIPALLTRLREDRTGYIDRRGVAGMALRYLTGQNIGDQFLLEEELRQWEEWWEQNKPIADNV